MSVSDSGPSRGLQVVSILLSTLALLVAGLSWWETSKTNSRAFEKERAELATKISISTARNKKTNTVRVTVSNSSNNTIIFPQFERSVDGIVSPTIVRLAEMKACSEYSFTVSGEWWNGDFDPRIVFKDANGNWWSRAESDEVKKSGIADRKQPVDEQTYKLAKSKDLISQVRGRDAVMPDRKEKLSVCG